ncbi:serine/threonine-protein phosphatase [Pseudoalteromonas ruthenica]|uniref:Serine/threonine-protein phosphatase n=1 Tax=Pseudoalteromonas ruthenica TaxID=151081 RepID=A0A5S3Z3E9_9GAMM|nr:Stp1/IreP family PP2C-type Ser/Thr phosphatase [Pseudoalteromonas ruthenica]TMP86752.1 serine/threonine-protein phosphatase [Pseudoalteromonas ruthenica]
MSITSYAQSHRGVVREINEDALVELPQHNVWVVADGMGGHAAGDYASQLVVDVLKRHLDSVGSGNVNCNVIIAALEDANTQLYQHSQENMDGKTMGSTAVVLFLHEQSYYFIWVGDSRGYLLRRDRLEQQTRDHSQVNELVDEGVITEEQAAVHPLSNVITRAVGVAPEVQPEVMQGKLQDKDVFLLCSDGLTGEVSDLEIESSLSPLNIIDAGMALMHSALVRGAKDNVTCILVKNNENHVQETNQCDQGDKTVPLF